VVWGELTLTLWAAQRVPRVGIAVIVARRSDNKVLVGKRKGSHGEGLYTPPPRAYPDHDL
jgi:hypothetical protein